MTINVWSSNNYYCHRIFGSVTQGIRIYVQHVESCPSKKIPGEGFDFLLQCKCSPAVLPLVEEKLKAVGATSIAVSLLRDRTQAQIEYHSMNHHSFMIACFQEVVFFPPNSSAGKIITEIQKIGIMPLALLRELCKVLLISLWY